MRLPVLSASLALTLCKICMASGIEERADTWNYAACYSDPYEARALPAYHYQSNSMSIAACQARCKDRGYLYAGMEWSIECWCDSKLADGAGKLDESRCNKACASGGGNCGGDNALSVYKLTLDNPPPTSGKWTYAACYIDEVASRTLQGSYYASTTAMTVSACLDTCQKQGYTLGGLEYGQECFCANAFQPGATKGDEKECSTPCTGKASDICGGSSRLSVYSFAASSGTDIPTDWDAVGCIVDNAQRALRSTNTQTQDMTPGKCIAFCDKAGYPLAATENGNECYCGSTIYKDNGSGVLVSKSECAAPCNGDSKQTCGGGYRLNLYRGPKNLQYVRTEHIVGTGFYDSFYFQDINDPTHGRVNYVAQGLAQSTNLTYATANTFVLRTDSKTTLTPGGPGRNSVRLISKKTWDTHVAVFDIKHMPQGCSTWPALWTTTENTWPNGGEVDILEGVNDHVPNTATLHTTEGCTMPKVRDQLGTAPTTDCNWAVNGNAGCGVAMSDNATYGPPFNANGGGWYAMERTDKFIKVWFWGRNAANIPAEVKAGDSVIDTSKWGTPQAFFPDTQCNIPKYFEPHNIIINLTLCGDWAGEANTWAASGCPGTCVDYVNNNPAAFANAYFEFASINVYTR